MITKLKLDIYAIPVTWMGWCMYYLWPFKKNIAKKNLRRVFQHSLTPAEIKHLTAAYYSHAILCIKEVLLFGLVNKKRLEKRIKIIGMEHLTHALSQEKGVIVFTGHFGNWEFAPLFLPEKIPSHAHRLHCIRKSLRFTWLNNIFLQRFAEVGFNVINKKNALRHVHAALRHKDIVFFPFDLRAGKHEKSKISVNFLGKNSTSYTSLAYLAERINPTILSICFYRLGKKQHVIEFYPEIKWTHFENKQQALVYNTNSYNRRLEEMLLAHPEQWIWSYKRWEF